MTLSRRDLWRTTDKDTIFAGPYPNVTSEGWSNAKSNDGENFSALGKLYGDVHEAG
jgi:hypothetical protein